mmetsp:Transcript_11167/g.20650  ORF Transcript_11167/g.20650 Transcript_11167/m.20650 type:complete len:123 (+) Transcript_11167:540-908(+)
MLGLLLGVGAIVIVALGLCIYCDVQRRTEEEKKDNNNSTKASSERTTTNTSSHNNKLSASSQRFPISTIAIVLDDDDVSNDENLDGLDDVETGGRTLTKNDNDLPHHDDTDSTEELDGDEAS